MRDPDDAANGPGVTAAANWPAPPNYDALLPAEVAAKAEALGVTKARLDTVPLFTLAVLGGAFIALGGVFATVATAGGSDMPFGASRLLIGVAFSLGLILVVVAGAELFTGNNLVIMAAASRRITAIDVLRNWTIVYLGNFVGALSIAGLIFLSREYTFGGGAFGLAALDIAAAKSRLDFPQAIALGVLCNALVCLAVWLCLGARSTTDRILAIVPPITAFVAAGFEHSIANMYFFPAALLIKAGAGKAEFWTVVDKSPSDYASITTDAFLVDNLLPVTIGNIIGGAVLVGLVYWFIYRRGAGAPGP